MSQFSRPGLSLAMVIMCAKNNVLFNKNQKSHNELHTHLIYSVFIRLILHSNTYLVVLMSINNEIVMKVEQWGWEKYYGTFSENCTFVITSCEFSVKHDSHINSLERVWIVKSMLREKHWKQILLKFFSASGFRLMWEKTVGVLPGRPFNPECFHLTEDVDRRLTDHEDGNLL